MMSKMNDNAIPRDAKEADMMLKEHGDLFDDIAAQKERIAKARALALEILKKNPNSKEAKEMLRRLDEEERMLDELWARKQKELTDNRDLQVWKVILPTLFQALCLLNSSFCIIVGTFIFD